MNMVRTVFLVLSLVTGIGGLATFLFYFAFGTSRYTVFANYSLPSEVEWSGIMQEHAFEIVDGPFDKEFLDGALIFGWNRCFRNFVCKFEWDFDKIAESKPLMLGGNMSDTERIARQIGWKRATIVLRKELLRNSEKSVRNQIVNIRKPILLIFLLIGLSCASLLVAVRSRSLTKLAHSQRSNDPSDYST